MKNEKPQKGNPHQLTVNQHCFPVASIARFADSDGCVEVKLLKHNKCEKFKPNNPLFCAKRMWDQRAESGYMKEIEDKYQELTESIVQGKVHAIMKDKQLVITDMFALWNIRWHMNQSPIPDQEIHEALDVYVSYSKDQQEELEKNGITVITPNLKIQGRHLSGLRIQQNLCMCRKQMADAHWGILYASKGEFVVPDNCSNTRTLPLSPVICLISQSESETVDEAVDEAVVSGINRVSVSGSKDYYFARNLAVSL